MIIKHVKIVRRKSMKSRDCCGDRHLHKNIEAHRDLQSQGNANLPAVLSL